MKSDAGISTSAPHLAIQWFSRIPIPPSRERSVLLLICQAVLVFAERANPDTNCCGNQCVCTMPSRSRSSNTFSAAAVRRARSTTPGSFKSVAADPEAANPPRPLSMNLRTPRSPSQSHSGPFSKQTNAIPGACSAYSFWMVPTPYTSVPRHSIATRLKIGSLTLMTGNNPSTRSPRDVQRLAMSYRRQTHHVRSPKGR